MKKICTLLLISAVFAGLLLFFKFGVVDYVCTPKTYNPIRYGEMYGPVMYFKNWVYGGLILVWGLALIIAICKKPSAAEEKRFWGEEARYWFLYPTPSAVEEIGSLLKKAIPSGDSIPSDDYPDEPQTLSRDKAAREIEKWLWASYADELLDLKAGEESLLAGYFVFVYDNVLSVQICYMTEFPGGAVFFGVDAARCDTDVFKVWISDINHSPEEVAAELQTVKPAINDGTWQDPCCDLKEQLTAWAKEKNILLGNKNLG